MTLTRQFGLFAAAALLSTTASAQDSSPSKALQTRVWVNTATHVYHCPGDTYYGKTREGEFMAEAQARGLGNHAVGNKGCNNAITPKLAPLPDETDTSKHLVWVNTASGVYHCPNAANWGATRRGRYLSESDASAAGAKPAGGRKCESR